MVSNSPTDDPDPLASPGASSSTTDEKVGFKRPPKKHRWPKGTSGNPSGKRHEPEPSPGNRLEALRQDLLDELLRLMDLDISDLQIAKNDSTVTALAKNILSDTFKRDGTYRKFFMQEFIGKAFLSERLRPSDPAAADAEMLQGLMRAVIDPTLSDSEAGRAMDRAIGLRETAEQYLARRKKRRRRRRKKPR